MEFIDLKAQYRHVEEDVKRHIQTVLDHGNYTWPGSQRAGGEAGCLLGVKHCITVANGTDASQIALMAVGVKPGDEVITPIPYIATAETSAVLKAKSVYVDVDPRTVILIPSN